MSDMTVAILAINFQKLNSNLQLSTADLQSSKSAAAMHSSLVLFTEERLKLHTSISEELESSKTEWERNHDKLRAAPEGELLRHELRQHITDIRAYMTAVLQKFQAMDSQSRSAGHEARAANLWPTLFKSTSNLWEWYIYCAAFGHSLLQLDMSNVLPVLAKFNVWLLRFIRQKRERQEMLTGTYMAREVWLEASLKLVDPIVFHLHAAPRQASNRSSEVVHKLPNGSVETLCCLLCELPLVLPLGHNRAAFVAECNEIAWRFAAVLSRAVSLHESNCPGNPLSSFLRSVAVRELFTLVVNHFATDMTGHEGQYSRLLITIETLLLASLSDTVAHTTISAFGQADVPQLSSTELPACIGDSGADSGTGGSSSSSSGSSSNVGSSSHIGGGGSGKDTVPRSVTSVVGLLSSLRASAITHPRFLSQVTKVMLRFASTWGDVSSQPPTTDRLVPACLPPLLLHCSTHLLTSLPNAQASRTSLARDLTTGGSREALASESSSHSPLEIHQLQSLMIRSTFETVKHVLAIDKARFGQPLSITVLDTASQSLHAYRSLPGALVFLEMSLRQTNARDLEHLLELGIHTAYCNLVVEIINLSQLSTPALKDTTSLFTTLIKLFQKCKHAPLPGESLAGESLTDESLGGESLARKSRAGESPSGESPAAGVSGLEATLDTESCKRIYHFLTKAVLVLVECYTSTLAHQLMRSPTDECGNVLAGDLTTQSKHILPTEARGIGASSNTNSNNNSAADSSNSGQDLSCSTKDIKHTNTNGGSSSSSTMDRSNSSDDSRILISSSNSSSSASTTQSCNNSKTGINLSSCSSSSCTPQSCNSSNTGVNLNSSTVSEHVRMPSSRAVLPLRQLTAILVMALTHSSCDRLLVRCGVCKEEDLSCQDALWFHTLLSKDPEMGAVATAQLSRRSQKENKTLSGTVSLTQPGARELEEFSVAHFHGRMMPSCCNIGCTNLAGVSEAALSTLLCSGCRRARYCSVACQRAAWLSGGHESVCNKSFGKISG